MTLSWDHMTTCIPKCGTKGRGKRSNHTVSMGCNYLTLPLIPASGTQVLIYFLPVIYTIDPSPARRYHLLKHSSVCTLLWCNVVGTSKHDWCQRKFASFTKYQINFSYPVTFNHTCYVLIDELCVKYTKQVTPHMTFQATDLINQSKISYIVTNFIDLASTSYRCWYCSWNQRTPCRLSIGGNLNMFLCWWNHLLISDG